MHAQAPQAALCQRPCNKPCTVGPPRQKLRCRCGTLRALALKNVRIGGTFSNSPSMRTFLRASAHRVGGETRATFFGNACDRYYAYLQEGRMYAFSKGNIHVSCSGATGASPRIQGGLCQRQEVVVFFEPVRFLRASAHRVPHLHRSF